MVADRVAEHFIFVNPLALLFSSPVFFFFSFPLLGSSMLWQKDLVLPPYLLLLLHCQEDWRVAVV